MPPKRINLAIYAAGYYGPSQCRADSIYITKKVKVGNKTEEVRLITSKGLQVLLEKSKFPELYSRNNTVIHPIKTIGDLYNLLEESLTPTNNETPVLGNIYLLCHADNEGLYLYANLINGAYVPVSAWGKKHLGLNIDSDSLNFIPSKDYVYPTLTNNKKYLLGPNQLYIYNKESGEFKLKTLPAGQGYVYDTKKEVDPDIKPAPVYLSCDSDTRTGAFLYTHINNQSWTTALNKLVVAGNKKDFSSKLFLLGCGSGGYYTTTDKETNIKTSHSVIQLFSEILKIKCYGVNFPITVTGENTKNSPYQIVVTDEVRSLIALNSPTIRKLVENPNYTSSSNVKKFNPNDLIKDNKPIDKYLDSLMDLPLNVIK